MSRPGEASELKVIGSYEWDTSFPITVAHSMRPNELSGTVQGTFCELLH